MFDMASSQVIVRAVGALHNLSSDPLAIPIIRDAVRALRRLLLRRVRLLLIHFITVACASQGGIVPLVDLLRKPAPSVCGSAAGAIQVCFCLCLAWCGNPNPQRS